MEGRQFTMIAVDTNVLVRYVTNDDPAQARKAMNLLGGADAILVTHTVLLELEWVLRAVYELSQQSIQQAMTQILGLANVNIERADRIATALSWYDRGMDFADALHLSLANGVDCFVTFDRRFAKAAAAEHLPVQCLSSEAGSE